MRRTLQRFVSAAALVGCAVAALPAAAGFSNAYYFGDSLSDTGNVFALTGGTTPPAPYFNGRFSDGPVWVEVLAAGIGLPVSATASLQGGNNYAFGGARTTGGSIPSLLVQVGVFVGGVPALDPNALYVVVAGGNDMRDARLAGAATIPGAATAAANNIQTALSQLAGKGARSVLVANLPDLGATPEAVALGLVAVSTQATDAFNALMPGVVGYGASLGLQMSFLDLAGLSGAVRNDALLNGGAVYGITNVSTPCGAFSGSIGISCSMSLFSDTLHPSARAHALIGAAAVAAVPEPSVVLMLLAGLLTVAAAARRHQAAVRTGASPSAVQSLSRSVTLL
jgi:outer membrane lipase/esterase